MTLVKVFGWGKLLTYGEWQCNTISNCKLVEEKTDNKWSDNNWFLCDIKIYKIYDNIKYTKIYFYYF